MESADKASSSTSSSSAASTRGAIPYDPEGARVRSKKLWDGGWLTVFNVGGFIYAQRKGIDSVAFILVARDATDGRKYAVTHEWKDPVGRNVTTAFGGSIDNQKYHADLRVLVVDEAIEESGFTVTFDDLRYHGKVLCSTQMNQFVYLFSVDVDKAKQGKRTTTDPFELAAEIQWLTAQEIAALQDWKAPTILMKRMLEDGQLSKMNENT